MSLIEKENSELKNVAAQTYMPNPNSGQRPLWAVD